MSKQVKDWGWLRDQIAPIVDYEGKKLLPIMAVNHQYISSSHQSLIEEIEKKKKDIECVDALVFPEVKAALAGYNSAIKDVITLLKDKTNE